MADNVSLTSFATDWRTQLRRNQRRTYWVIFVFILFYLAIGLLIDMYYYSSIYPIPLSQIFAALVTFQLRPNATLITLAVALISLFVTYKFYDKLMMLGTDYKEITADSTDLQEKQLYNVVEEMKIASSLNFMPKVYLIDADYMNAFASGYSEKTAFVAITRGLFTKLDREELQAVMAHELSHVRHGDIRLILTASVLSNILLIAIDLMFYNVVFGRDRRADGRLVFIIMILRYLLPLATLLLMLYLSRTREYMADAGCVELMRNNMPLANALMKIDQDSQQNSDQYRAQYSKTAHEDVRRAAYLYDPVQAGIEPVRSLANLFSTHPDIAHRLAAIGVKYTSTR